MKRTKWFWLAAMTLLLSSAAMAQEIAAPPVHMRVESEQPGVGLHIVDRSMSARGGFGRYSFSMRGYEFQSVCHAPCAVRLAPGTYHFAVSQGVDEALPVNHLTTAPGPATLQLEYSDRTVYRVVGWSAFVLSFAPMALGLAMAIGYLGPNNDTQGGVVLTLGALMHFASYIFIFLENHRDVKVFDERGAIRF